jgi:hypothetical protein
MVAMLLLGVALVAISGSFDASGRSSLSAQRHEQAVSIAQRELEKVRSLGWGAIGMASTPVQEAAGNPVGDNTPAAPRNPNFYVNAGRLKIKSNFLDSGSAALAGTPAAGEPFVTPGDVQPGPTAFTSGATTGQVYRHVTWRSDCIAGQACDGQNSKRVTVAVVLDHIGGDAGPAKPVWLTTIVTDPTARPAGVPNPEVNPGSGADVTAQPFFLYDTPCTNVARQPITASHVTRNTSQAASTCSTAAGPDLMWVDAPPDDPTAPLFDYSTDLLRESDPAGGLVLQQDAGETCPTQYAGTPAATVDAGKRRIHSWATPALTTAFATPTSDARTAFSFWTQTAEGGQGAATLCFTLLKLSGNTRTALATHSYSRDAWPSDEPEELTFAFAHSPFTLAVGERLLVTVSVKASSESDIVLFYDHPRYQSFITVRTTTPIAN